MEDSFTKKNIGTILALVVFIVAGLFVLLNTGSDNQDIVVGESGEAQNIDQVPSRLSGSALTTNYQTASIDLENVLSGGPGKDGIPAISDPKFQQINDSNVTDETQVIFVENEGEQKLYPYNILVWHEIVNDTVGGKPLAITFCPLCGSAIVFDREINSGVVEFGVSGFLYESNLLMYSREDTESLWSQSRGEAVVGDLTGEELEHFPLRLLTFGEAKVDYPDAVVLSDDTGYGRDYTGNPYVGYEDTEDTIFPVSVQDNRFPAKEIFYIVPIEGNSIAVRQDKTDGIYQVPDSDIFVTIDKGRITANWGEAELPGYFEMWFSWATHHSETGTVL